MAADEESPLYIKYADDITNPFIQDCEKKYNIECIGTGGRFAYNVAKINVKFICHRVTSIEDARVMEVEMIEDLLNRINTSEKIRPFLSEYPFKAEQIAITTTFQDKENEFFKDRSLALVCPAKNKFFYHCHDPNDPTMPILLEESYEDALKIVQGKK